jgi:subtilisin family serine protease
MALRLLFLTAFAAAALTGCGQAQTMSTTSINAASGDCTGQALPNQFLVRNQDGSTVVVQADSEEAMLNGYMKEHADQIKIVEHDYKVHALGTVLPMSADNTTTTADNWGDINIEADKLWAQNIRGSQILVAVVDTGVDVTHPQLTNQIAVNLGESGTDAKGNNKQTNGIDDDGNGYVDDYYGMNFADQGTAPLTGDNQFHGTHVAGILGAAHSDTVAAAEPYVQGVAPQVKIIPAAFLDSAGSGYMSDAVRAIDYAVVRGAKVINASWGGADCSQVLKDTISGLAAKNVVFVVAAGNDSLNIDHSPEYPASLNLTAQITVGAIGDHDYMADYSNYGAQAVHIFAPGTNIVSTLPGNTMGFLSGTSMATPFVTGALALMLSAVPDANVTQLRQALYNSAVHSTNYLNASQGRLDLAQAVVQLHTIVGH